MPDDGVSHIPAASTGGAEMPMSERTKLILEESRQNHSSLMHESRANEQNTHNIARLSGVRKYDGEDPIEAASAEVILNLNNG